MKTISNPAPAKWEKLAKRPEIRPDKLRKMVNDVFRDIAKQGDRAVLKYSRKFDYPEQTSLSVEQSMIDKAADNLSQQLNNPLTWRDKISKSLFVATRSARRCGDCTGRYLLARIESHRKGRHLHSGRVCPTLFNRTDAGYSCKKLQVAEKLCLALRPTNSATYIRQFYIQLN